jgi:uncharacterized protein YbjT (DUF2867 family)
MSHPILVTGAAGGQQGSTGRHITNLLLEQGIEVRTLVHKLDARSDGLRERGAEVVAGDLLDPASVRSALKNVKRAFFTYPVAQGLLEASTIFAAAARDAGTELVVNNSQLQNTPEVPSFRNLQHRLADAIFNWAQVGAVHIQAPPYYENLRALISRSVTEKDTIFLPWGDGGAVIPLADAEDVSRVAAALLINAGAPSRTAYELVGAVPTVNEIAEALSRVLQRPIRYVPITDEQWREAVKDRINAHALDHLSHLWQYFRSSGIGRGENGLHITDAVRTVTGKDPLSLEQFIRNNMEAFGGLRQTAS